jgi:hypothetical protein
VKAARRPTATVSGSFRRGMGQVQETVYALTDMGVHVLSPADPRVVDEIGTFLFVASDRLRSVRLVQQRHLEAIAASDFLWLVCPDGYVGLSAAMEIGFAVSRGVAVMTDRAPSDLTLRQFVTIVGSLAQALEQVRPAANGAAKAGVLVDPADSIEVAHNKLERVRRLLEGRVADPEGDDDSKLGDALKGIQALTR